MTLEEYISYIVDSARRISNNETSHSQEQLILDTLNEYRLMYFNLLGAKLQQLVINLHDWLTNGDPNALYRLKRYI